MLRHYYITLCGDYFGQCVDICATDKESAVTLTEKVYGIMNVSTAYTDKAWAKKYTKCFRYIGKIENCEEKEYLRRRKISF